MASASEKLRALNSRLLRPWPSGQDPFIELGVALPLIADVVEAAEEYRRIQFTKPPTEVQHAGAKLDRALTVLREHLEGGGVT